MKITERQLQQLRQKAGKRLTQLLVALTEEGVPQDIIVDKLVRMLSPLADSLDGRPYVHLFPQGMKLKEYRTHAASRIEKLLSNLKVKEFSEVDHVLDTLLRELSNLPSRPKGRDVYLGLFNLDAEEKKALYTPLFTCKPSLAEDQCINAGLILEEAHRQGVTRRPQLAYLLATAEHESGLRPVRDGYSDRVGRAEARKRGYSGGELYYGK